MANVQLPVLFQIADATGATLFGEEVSVDVIENHLKFTLKRNAAFNSPGYDATNATSTLAAAFADTFYVGNDDANGDALFYVNMIAGIGTETLSKKVLVNTATVATAEQVVDQFCNKFADAILKAQGGIGLVHATDANKKVPIGGKAAEEFYSSSLAPAESEALDVGALMSRVAAVHLVGHPLAQAIFADEDAISGHLTAAPTASNPGNIFTSELAKLLSHALGGSQATNKLAAANSLDRLVKMDGDGKVLYEASASGAASGVAPLNIIAPANLSATLSNNIYYYNFEGVVPATGKSNNALKSLLEQLLNISGRSAKLNDVRSVGYAVANGAAAYSHNAFPNMQTVDSSFTSFALTANTNVITAPLPVVGGGAGTGDTIGVFLRPKLKLKFENSFTGAANISMIEVKDDGTVTNIASDSIATTTQGASGISTVFPGLTPAANGETQALIDDFQAGKYGWMGSDNTPNTDTPALKRSLTQTSTDEDDTTVMDQHIWRITIQM